MLFTLGVAAENADTEKITNVVRLLEIMHGDENGNLNLGDKVTRAEFVKMAICASTHKSSAETAPKSSLFPDVRSDHWATRYISVAISNGWINGYLDGTFRPDNNVKLEEAVNIVLKVLGYTEKDLAGAYPEPQMANYTSLGLDTYITTSRGEYLTREDCMYLIYNMINTKNKNGTVHAQILGYPLDSDDKIDYLGVVDDNTDGPVLARDGWQSTVGISPDKMMVWRDGKRATADEIKDYDVLYYSKLINTVWAYSNKQFGILQSASPATSPTTVTVSGKNYALGNSSVKYKFSTMGDFAEDDIVVLLFGTDNKVEFAFDAYEIDYNVYIDGESDYVLLTQYSLEDAFIAEDDNLWKINIPFDTSCARVYKNGVISSASEIKKYDVVYYSKLLNTVWSYDDKKSGIVNGVSPSRSAPTSVNVSGSNYAIASDSVAFALSELGNIDEGDVVTLLLGRDGMAEGILTADAADNSFYMQGDLSYEQIVNASTEGPYIVNGTNYKTQIPFDIGEASVYRNDKPVDASEISEWDVYYYSKPLKTVWVYQNTVSGRYEAALPDKSAPQSITLSGKTYQIETSAVSYKLSSAGSFNIGDSITLLLGKGGAVAGVVSADELSKEIIGIVTDFYTKEYQTAYGSTYTSNCAVVTDLDGNSMEYPTTMATVNKGRMVSVKTTSSGTRINIISKNYDDVKALNAAMRENKYADGAQIADLCGSKLTPVYASRLENCTVEKGDVVYYKLNADGEISILVLDDYIGDNHTYVMLTSVSESFTSKNIIGRYEYFGASGEGSLTLSTVFGVSDGPCAIEYNGNNVEMMENLEMGVRIDTVGNLTALSGEVTYDIWDKAHVFEYKNSEYRVMTMADIENNDNYTLTGWLDKSVDRGGIIRMIIAVPKK